MAARSDLVLQIVSRSHRENVLADRHRLGNRPVSENRVDSEPIDVARDDAQQPA